MCARVSTKHVKSINIGIEKLFQTVPTTLYPPIANFFFVANGKSDSSPSSRNYTTKIRNIIFSVPPPFLLFSFVTRSLRGQVAKGWL